MKTNASNSPNSIEEPLFTYYSELGTVSKGTLYDEPDGFYVYSLPSQDLLYDSFDSIQEQIHLRLIDLDNLINERLFGNQSAYYSIICFCPTAISEGGFSPEMTFDRNSFANYIKRFSFEEVRRLIYLDHLKYLTESFYETCNQARELTENDVSCTRRNRAHWRHLERIIQRLITEVSLDDERSGVVHN